jgi:hypothetical protein
VKWYVRTIRIVAVFASMNAAHAVEDPPKPTLYLPIYFNANVEKEVVDALNAKIRTVKRELKEVVIVDDPKAIYALTGLDVIVGRSGVSLTGKFSGRRQQNVTHYGDCRGQDCPKDQVDLAFAALLHKTLFHHDRGPYAPIAVTHCERVGDKGMLTLNWRRGPGLEKYFLYEMAERKRSNIYAPITYLKLDDLESDIEQQGDTTSVQASFRFTNLEALERCVVDSRQGEAKQGRFFLLLRLMKIEQFGGQVASPAATK